MVMVKCCVFLHFINLWLSINVYIDAEECNVS